MQGNLCFCEQPHPTSHITHPVHLRHGFGIPRCQWRHAPSRGVRPGSRPRRRVGKQAHRPHPLTGHRRVSVAPGLVPDIPPEEISRAVPGRYVARAASAQTHTHLN